MTFVRTEVPENKYFLHGREMGILSLVRCELGQVIFMNLNICANCHTICDNLLYMTYDRWIVSDVRDAFYGSLATAGMSFPIVSCNWTRNCIPLQVLAPHFVRGVAVSKELMF